jgi:signal peptidase
MNNKPLPGIRTLQQTRGGSDQRVTFGLANGAELILAEKGPTPYALKDKRSDVVFFCAHTGNSMHPTLSEHDLLEIEPYGGRPVRYGDVIFFLLPHGEQPVVHRVVRMTAEGIRTKGDNNTHIDPWFIRPQDVIGQVVRATRGKKERSIYGGRVGQLWSFGIRGFTVVEKGFSFFYHRMARSGLLRRLIPLHKRMRIVALRRNDGRAFKLLLGHLLIGNYQPGMNYWQIRRPFRLFVDERSLPR